MFYYWFNDESNPNCGITHKSNYSNTIPSRPLEIIMGWVLITLDLAVEAGGATLHHLHILDDEGKGGRSGGVIFFFCSLQERRRWCFWLHIDSNMLPVTCLTRSLPQLLSQYSTV